MTTTVHISSLIIQTLPERLEEIRADIQGRGAEIPMEDARGKLIAVIETEDEAAISSFANSVATMDGVLSANLVYHLIDDMDPGEPGPAGEHP